MFLSKDLSTVISAGAMHEKVNPKSLLALHAISLAGGTRLSLRAWRWKEKICFFPVASVRDPSHLLFLSSWDAFFLNLFWSFCFSLSYSSFEWGHYWLPAVSQLAESQRSWPLLERFDCFYLPAFFFSSNLYSPLVWWGGSKYPFPGAAKCRPHIVSTLVPAAQSESARLRMKDLDILTETCPLLKASCNPSPCLLTQRTSTPSHKPDKGNLRALLLGAHFI